MNFIENLNWPAILVALTAVLVISRVNHFMSGLKAVNHLVGPRVPFAPLSVPGVLVPTTWWNPGLFYIWHWRNHFYKTWGSENVAFVPWLSGRPTLMVTNLDVARQVTLGAHRSSWEKPVDQSQALLMFGMNLVAAEGEQWRKHRRIAGPAFTNELYQMAWQETYNLYNEMIEEEGLSAKDAFEAPVVQNLTFKLALSVIGNCGFGFNFRWAEPPFSPDGTLSIQEAMRTVSEWHALDVFCPKWVTKLPVPQFKKYRAACDKLMDFMRAQVVERREIINGGSQLKGDVFTMLVKANEDEEEKLQLDDEELIGNVFVMLLAGHETTAHTLAATLGFLAIHDEIQEDVHEEVMSVFGRRDPVTSLFLVFNDFTKLEKVVSVFYEALRLFPAGFVLIRRATEDTVLQVPNPVGQEGTTSVPIQKGTDAIVDMIGIQNNTRYFDEPEKFKPQRWYGISNESESFSAFSVGPRACIGRKFATLEAVCFIACLMRDWKVEPLLNSGETKEEWKKRVVDAKMVLTLGVKDVPLRFVRRK
ncbi:cytochrome P450 [Pluteus cervinus]|uniref:Cytochrome P450 n=1 Tax=Pluteus cervinus TaxID=181527 RepID=A0ACD3B693_9AGAR|nr:cytochrome P450 [Pluteus cervinus]